MPIDYEAIIAPFRTAYFLQRRSINESLRKLAEWLTKRLPETQQRERETRGLPVFSFSSGALSVWIDTSQHGALGPEGEPPPTSFRQGAAAPFVALWNGLLLAPTMIEAEGVLPATLDTLARTVKMIVDALDRFKTPSKALFDVTIRKTWQDLFGEVGLFFRMINNPATLERVKTFSAGGIKIIDVLRQHFPSQPPGEQKAAAGGMVETTRLITAGILLVPLAARFIVETARTADIVTRLKILDRVTLIQNEIFALRIEAIDFLYVTLYDIGRQTFEWLIMAQSDVLFGLDLYSHFIGAFLTELQDWLKTTGKELKSFLDGLIDFLYKLGDALKGLMDKDFGAALTFHLIHFSLSDILEWRADPSKAREKQQEIDDFMRKHKIIAFFGKERLLALREVIGIAGTRTPFPFEAVPTDLSGVAFPNIYEAFFGGKEAANLRTALAAAGPALKTNVDNIFGMGIAGLTELGETMSKAGTDAAKLGSTARYARLTKNALALGETAFGADAMGAGLVERSDPIAIAFQSWLSGSGFTLVGKALPKYVAEMVEYWKEEASKPPSARPTSPHILARRAQVNRVRLPRMVIRVHEERELDKVLAAEVADHARFGVAQAFQLAIAQHERAG